MMASTSYMAAWSRILTVSHARSVVDGWGVETGPMASLLGPGDPHAYILIEDTAGSSVPWRANDAAGLSLTACPSPFSSSVRASYALERSTHVRLDVYDVEGRLVATLADGLEQAGERCRAWDGLDSRGHSAGS